MGRCMEMHVILVLSCVCVSVLAQYGEGPLPPRLQIPGAIPVPGPGPGPGPQRPRVAVRQRRPQPQARQQAYLPTPPNDLDDGPTPRPPPILAQARPAPLPTTLPPRPVEEDPEEYDDDEETAAPPSTQTPTTAVVFAAPQQPIFRTSRPPQPSPTPSVFAAPQQPIFRTARPQIRNQDPPAQFRQQAQPARPAARPVVQLTSPVGVNVGDIPVSPNRQQFRQQSPPRPAAFRPERPIIPEPPRQQQLVRQQEDSPRQQQSPRPAVFRPERPAIPEPPRQQLVRQQEESPRQQQRQQSRPTPVAVDDEDEDIPDVPRQQFRQQPRPTPQAAPQQFVRQQQRQQPQPQQKQQQAYSPYKPPRDRKPVAQVLRKYRDDNPDGSITWGYENDDGSFKEETIGVDCVVSGKYGYVDPDGMRREYTYSSGIPCDKNKEEEEKGYMDYQNNAFVLPNGQSIDLQSFNNHKSRRPVAGK